MPVPSGSTTLGVLICYSANTEIPDDTRTAVMTGIAAHAGEFLERRRAEQYAAELDQSRDEYIALVGHELRTPLTSIQSYTDMLLTEPGMTIADRTQMLQVMNRNTDRLPALIAGCSTWPAPARGRSPCTPGASILPTWSAPQLPEPLRAPRSPSR
ncbi:sensor histidine kinase KdpD [Actinoplanes sp. TFC3]|uniref:sensor histidine kinase n=1 Tax=Actinoplanes sp. TFC3 TaxID=1710355 RepID=UPI000AAC94BC|nr:histidine kinase dimerization/phospho-acceptor domain-containing protein [Actinoplanes sp. TFC3]